MRLEGQTVVIVGGSSGIGRGAATALLDRGASVVLVARSIDKLREASDALGGPPHVRIFSADARRETDVERLFREIGRFDHLVVTSGIVPPTAPIASFDLGVARELIETVLLVPITLAKYAHGVIRVGGSITFTSGNFEGPSGHSRRLGDGCRGRLSRLLRPCPRTRARPDAGECRLTRLGQDAHVGHDRRGRQERPLGRDGQSFARSSHCNSGGYCARIPVPDRERAHDRNDPQGGWGPRADLNGCTHSWILARGTSDRV